MTAALKHQKRDRGLSAENWAILQGSAGDDKFPQHRGIPNIGVPCADRHTILVLNAPSVDPRTAQHQDHRGWQKCSTCKKMGHITDDCWYKEKTVQEVKSLRQVRNDLYKVDLVKGKITYKGYFETGNRQLSILNNNKNALSTL
ncbi:unnamed protein product [Brassicogethes aeneus]|uniref:CCHC-type domain-containing protein n=1 Tax=Brassicogethes aeneus TaxID=1431903 RepID=A0A9P0FMV1_BRAAE|nr:unnamed protein product [Brassicogethes aeneus]